nr:GntR family transcriptional regulator [Candidatus Brocadiales bacterium]
GVNRGDVRQAFSRLIAEGLVVRGKRGGVFVREYTEQDLEETQEVRQIIETAAARLAIERAEEADFSILEETAQHMLLMANNGYILGVSEGDLRFHSLLVEAAHNNKLTELYTRANIPLSGINYIGKLKEQRQEALIIDAQDHIKIVKLLREKKIEPLLKFLIKR